MNDHKGAALMLPVVPRARELIGDRGYKGDRFGRALLAKGIRPCIPPRRNRKVKHPYSWMLPRQRHRIENMFGRLKDWRRIATRYDGCCLR